MIEELKKITFKAYVPKPKTKGYYNYASFTLLRMACYPLTKQEGDKNPIVQLHLSRDGQLTDVLEQQQFGVSDLDAIDLELSKYYFYLEEGEEYFEDIEEYERDEYEEIELELKICFRYKS